MLQKQTQNTSLEMLKAQLYGTSNEKSDVSKNSFFIKLYISNSFQEVHRLNSWLLARLPTFLFSLLMELNAASWLDAHRNTYIRQVSEAHVKPIFFWPTWGSGDVDNAWSVLKGAERVQCKHFSITKLAETFP